MGLEAGRQALLGPLHLVLHPSTSFCIPRPACLIFCGLQWPDTVHKRGGGGSGMPTLWKSPIWWSGSRALCRPWRPSACLRWCRGRKWRWGGPADMERRCSETWRVRPSPGASRKGGTPERDVSSLSSLHLWTSDSCPLSRCYSTARGFQTFPWNACGRDFPDGPGVNTSPSNSGDVGSIPGQGTKILHASGPRNQNIKQKQYCNKFNKDFKNGPH